MAKKPATPLLRTARRPLTGSLLLFLAASPFAAPVAGAADPRPATQPAAAATPQRAVYRWAISPANVDAFGEWLGAADLWAEDFTNNESWDNVENPGWLLHPWAKWVQARPGRRLIFGVPLLTGPWDRSGPRQGTIDAKVPVSFAKGAAGDYNRHFAALAKNLVADGLGNTILRPGWEFNGGWYTWRAAEKPEDYAEYWRQLVKAMRAVPGTEHLQFCWNPALGYLGFPAEKAWPGDEFVDYVGLDVYDDSWAKDTYPWPQETPAAGIDARHRKVWNDVILHGDHGLLFWKKFAADHHKPLAFPEWGVSNRQDKHGGLDNPYFIEQMHGFITDPANNVAFQCYFDVEAPDGHHQLSPGPEGKQKTEFPESAAKFLSLFGKAK